MKPNSVLHNNDSLSLGKVVPKETDNTRIDNTDYHRLMVYHSMIIHECAILHFDTPS